MAHVQDEDNAVALLEIVSTSLAGQSKLTQSMFLSAITLADL